MYVYIYKSERPDLIPVHTSHFPIDLQWLEPLNVFRRPDLILTVCVYIYNLQLLFFTTSSFFLELIRTRTLIFRVCSKNFQLSTKTKLQHFAKSFYAEKILLWNKRSINHKWIEVSWMENFVRAVQTQKRSTKVFNYGGVPVMLRAMIPTTKTRAWTRFFWKSKESRYPNIITAGFASKIELRVERNNIWTFGFRHSELEFGERRGGEREIAFTGSRLLIFR